jgi:hypothetical protein
MYTEMPSRTLLLKGGELKIVHFFLPDLLLAHQKLALNLETRVLSLLSEGPQIVVQKQFSVNEMNMLLPILEYFPHYCPYEVLLSRVISHTVTASTIDNCRRLLEEARRNGTAQQELRPVRRALSSLRNKLLEFHLGISNIRERGCSLTGLYVSEDHPDESSSGI